MSLTDWERNGWLTAHRASANEIRELLAVVDRDLADSGAEALSADWRLNIAYNAALQARGGRLSRRTRPASLSRDSVLARDPLGSSATVINAFDAFRKKRNLAGYERAGLVSDADAKAMRVFAVALRKEVAAWIKEHHSSLLR